MAKRLAVPKHLQHLIEKRERDRRGKARGAGKGLPQGDRRKTNRRKSD
jgi:hypothetical protein